MKRKRSHWNCIPVELWILLLSGTVWGSAVTVELNSVSPDPCCPNTMVTARATATFTADGEDRREQEEEGAVVQYRWLWEFQTDGSISTTSPPLDSENPPWTVWSTENTSWGRGSVPTAGYKKARIIVQARMVKEGEGDEDGYVGETCECMAQQWFTAVCITALRYLDGGTWASVPALLSICRSESIFFRAVPYPSGGGWPYNRPYWIGPTGASLGTGEEKTVNFPTASASVSEHWTVTACCSGSATANVFVTGADRLQYMDDGNWVDAPSTLYLLPDTTLDFRVLSSPEGASWPPDKPVWGGSATVSPSGDGASVSFGGLSSSSFDYRTVTAQCGNTKTCRGLVVNLSELLYFRDGAYCPLPSTLYVAKGDTVTFMAVRTPSGSVWPEGYPVWGGTVGIAGTGMYRSVTFYTLSTGPADYQTVQVSCDVDRVANVIVDDVASAQARKPDDSWVSDEAVWAKPETGTFTVPLRAPLSVSALNEYRKPWTFSWEIENCPSGSGASIQNSDNLSTGLAGIDQLGVYTLRAEAGGSTEGETVDIRVVRLESITAASAGGGGSASTLYGDDVRGKFFLGLDEGGTCVNLSAECTGGIPPPEGQTQWSLTTRPAGSSAVPAGAAAAGFAYTATVPGLYTFRATAGNALGVDFVVGDFILGAADVSDHENYIYDADGSCADTLYLGMEPDSDCKIIVAVIAQDSVEYPDSSRKHFEITSGTTATPSAGSGLDYWEVTLAPDAGYPTYNNTFHVKGWYAAGGTEKAVRGIDVTLLNVHFPGEDFVICTEWAENGTHDCSDDLVENAYDKNDMNWVLEHQVNGGASINNASTGVVNLGSGGGCYTVTATANKRLKCTDTATLKVIKVKFKEPNPLCMRWSSGDRFRAKDHLTNDSYNRDYMTWTMSTEEGAEAAIDKDTGVVTFGDGGGEYAITATSRDLPEVAATMTLRVIRLDLDGREPDPEGGLRTVLEEDETAPPGVFLAPGTTLLKVWDPGITSGELVLNWSNPADGSIQLDELNTPIQPASATEYTVTLNGAWGDTREAEVILTHTLISAEDRLTLVCNKVEIDARQTDDYLVLNDPSPQADAVVLLQPEEENGRLLFEIRDEDRQPVCVLADENCDGGSYTRTWDGTRDTTGELVPPGRYAVCAEWTLDDDGDEIVLSDEAALTVVEAVVDPDYTTRFMQWAGTDAGGSADICVRLLPEGLSGKLTLRMTDGPGEDVTLVDGVETVGGEHDVPWNGRDADGNPVLPGCYKVYAAWEITEGVVAVHQETELTVVRVDIVFADATEEEENAPGVFLAVNDNDNAGGGAAGEGNGTVDLNDVTRLDSDGLPSPDPDLIEFRLIVSPPLEQGILTLTIPDNVIIWGNTYKSEDPAEPLAPGGDYSLLQWDLSASSPIIIASASSGSLTILTAALEGAVAAEGTLLAQLVPETGAAAIRDEAQVVPVAVDLEFDSLPEETEAAPHEEDPGGFIMLNDDDDDGDDDVIDKDRPTGDPELDQADPDLKALSFDMDEAVPDSGTIHLEIPAGLRVWENAKKKSLITGPWNLAVPSEKTAFESLISNGAWLEGTATGNVDLVLQYKNTAGKIVDADEVALTVLEVEKIPLGGNASLSEFIIGKVYVPTSQGGEIELEGTDIELFYTDGDDLELSTATQIYQGILGTHLVASGNPCSYCVEFPASGWYYAKVGVDPVNVTNTFTQKGQTRDDRIPWSGYWWPFADKTDTGSNIINLYDPGQCMEKFDTAFNLSGSDSAKEWEAESYALTAVLSFYGLPFQNVNSGHMIARQTVRESHAEQDFLFDLDGDGTLEDPGPFDWTVPGDGLYTDTRDVSWYGHCNGWCVASILFMAPKDETEGGESFSSEDMKGLLTELGCRYPVAADMSEKAGDYLASEWTRIFHETLCEWVRVREKCVYADLLQTNRTGSLQVWNHPVYQYEATFSERDGDIYSVDVVCTTTSASDSPPYYTPRQDIWHYHLKYEKSGLIVEDGSGCGWDDGVWCPRHITHPYDLGGSWLPCSNPHITEAQLEDISDVGNGELRRDDY